MIENTINGDHPMDERTIRARLEGIKSDNPSGISMRAVEIVYQDRYKHELRDDAREAMARLDEQQQRNHRNDPQAYWMGLWANLSLTRGR